MTESKVAASIKKARKEADAAEKKRRESNRKKREAERKMREDLGALLLEVGDDKGDFAAFKNRSVADLLSAVFGNKPGADAHGSESEGGAASDSAGTEGSEPSGTYNGSEGGYSNGTHQSQG